MPERLDVIREDLFERERSERRRAGSTLRTGSKHKARDPRQDARQLQLRQHAIDAVVVLADILAEQDRTVPRRQVR